MSVRAKFVVSGMMDYGSQKEVHLRALHDPITEEDRRFCRATPSGDMKMRIDNPVALAEFQIGALFYVDFHRVTDPAG